MAKSMTKSAIIAHLAQKTDLSKKQVVDVMDQLALARHQGSQERLRAAELRPARAGQSQGADGAQPADRRADQDPGQARGEVPARQVAQGLGAWQEVTRAARSRTGRSPHPGRRPSSCSASPAHGRHRRRQFDVGWGAWDGERLVGALLMERAGGAAMLHGPVVVAPARHARRGRLGVAADLTARGARPSPLPAASRPSSRARRASTGSGCAHGFIPVPEAELPRPLRGRPGIGLFGWRGGTALWSTAGRGGSALRPRPRRTLTALRAAA